MRPSMPRPSPAREERSIQEVLDQRPAPWLRRSMWWVFLGLVLLALAAFLIPLPRVIRLPVVVYLQPPPQPLRTAVAGQVGEIRVRPPCPVEEGQILLSVAYQGPTGWMDSLESHLLALLALERAVLPLPIPAALPPELTAEAHVLHEHIFAYRTRMADREGLLAAEALAMRRKALRKKMGALEEQQSALQKERDIAEKRLANLEQLFERGAVSDLDVDAARLVFFQYQRRVQELAHDRAELDLQFEQLQNTAARQSLQQEIKLQQERQAMRRQADELLKKLRRWKARHFLTAPSEGVLEEALPIQTGRFVPAETVVYYLHSQSDSGYAEGLLPEEDLKAVHPGLPASIRLHAYPHRTHGALRGRLSWISPQISPLPDGQKAGYRLRIALDAKPVASLPASAAVLSGQARLDLGKQTLWRQWFSGPLFD